MSIKRELGKEYRRRVDALHSAYEDSLGKADYLDAASDCDLDFRHRISRRFVGSRKATYMTSRVAAWSCRVRSFDPSIRIQLAVGRNLAQKEALNGIPFYDHAPNLFVAGNPHFWSDAARDMILGTWPGFSVRDLSSIASLPLSTDSSVIPASWSPLDKTRLWDCDVMRPPAEAIALVGQHIRGNASIEIEQYSAQPSKKILTHGLGFGLAAQALSAALPNDFVYHLNIPYARYSDSDTRLLLRLCHWDWIVIGIPSSGACAIATYLGSSLDISYKRHKAILAGAYCDDELIVSTRSILAACHRTGTQIALLAEPKEYHRFIQSHKAILASRASEKEHNPVWVDYVMPEKTHFGLPSPGGRLVSFWEMQ